MNDYYKEIQFLIDDEIEAVEGYNKVIKLYPDIAKLKKIRDEELKHIEILKSLLVFDADEEGDVE